MRLKKKKKKKCGSREFDSCQGKICVHSSVRDKRENVSQVKFRRVVRLLKLHRDKNS